MGAKSDAIIAILCDLTFGDKVTILEEVVCEFSIRGEDLFGDEFSQSFTNGYNRGFDEREEEVLAELRQEIERELREEIEIDVRHELERKQPKRDERLSAFSPLP